MRKYLRRHLIWRPYFNTPSSANDEAGVAGLEAVSAVKHSETTHALMSYQRSNTLVLNDQHKWRDHDSESDTNVVAILNCSSIKLF